MKNERRGLKARLLAMSVGVCLVGSALAVSANDAEALQLYDGGKWKVQLDTTVSYGMMWRVADRDDKILGFANGGSKYSVNYDDGNLNYKKGLVSSLAKINTELDVAAENFGLFVRGKAFYDYVNMDKDRERTPLSSDAEDKVGKSVDLLDAYLWTSIDAGNVPIQVRVGEQVVSWGESTFIQGGINSINPIDVAAIRGPGAELKEALTPEGMAWASAGLTENLSVEGVYVYDWGETELEPKGTYFSTIDFASPGAFKLVLGEGFVPDLGDAPAGLTPVAVPRGRNLEGDDDDQFGLAVRYFSPELHDTEFGLFYLKYNNRLPNLSASVLNAPPAEYVPGSFGGGLPDYLQTVNYHAEYVNEIEMIGASFSTEVGGVALQGEYSFKKDAPLQIDDVELLVYALSPAGLGGYSQMTSYLGPWTPADNYLEGYILRDISQVQMTATQILKPFWGTDGAVLLAEVGLNHVHNMPSTNELRLEGPGTVTHGDPWIAANIFSVPNEPDHTFADATSWGYVLFGQLDFNNAIGAINLSPSFAFAHDVNGNSPFGGPFQEGKKSITLALGASYFSWSADLSYTDFFGVEAYNWVNDRDNVALNIKYSF